MSDGEARVVTLKKSAVGSKVTEADFHIETRTLPDLAEGDLLLETLELSPDPGMRGRMTGVDNFFRTAIATWRGDQRLRRRARSEKPQPGLSGRRSGLWLDRLGRPGGVGQRRR